MKDNDKYSNRRLKHLNEWMNEWLSFTNDFEWNSENGKNWKQ